MQILWTRFDKLEESLSGGAERSVIESSVLCLVFLLLTALSVVANGTVIISAILRRWKEVDNFTFAFCVSLSFNNFFLAFHCHSMIAYSMAVSTWSLSTQPCILMGVLSSYLNTLHFLHVLMVIFDSIFANIDKYSYKRALISVSLSKRIALHTWFFGILPQFSPFIFYRDNPYLYNGFWGGCYQHFMFKDSKTLMECIGLYVVLPFMPLIMWYLVQIFQEDTNRRITLSDIRKADARRNDFYRRHRVTFLITITTIICHLPYVLCSMVGLGTNRSITRGVYEHVVHLSNILFCCSGIIIPIIYLVTCPTFCRFVIRKERNPVLHGWLLGDDISRNLRTLTLTPGYENLTLYHGPLTDIAEDEREMIAYQDTFDMEESDDIESQESEYIELPAISIRTACQAYTEQMAKVQLESEQTTV